MTDWFNPRQATPDSEAIMDRLTRASHHFRSNWARSTLNAQYGLGERQQYDLFLPPEDRPICGLQVFVHGGFWSSRHKDQFSFLAPGFLQEGWAMAIMTYPLMPQIRLPDLVDQTAAGLTQIIRVQTEALATSEVVVTGHSAGAHLAAMAFHSSRGQQHTHVLRVRPHRLVLVSGVYELMERAAAPVSATIGLTPEDALLSCPLTHCSPSPTETYIFAGQREPARWCEQGTTYQRYLKDNGLSHVHHELVAGHDHFTLLEAIANPASEISRCMRAEQL
jgi:acetyl esterase/lipase